MSTQLTYAELASLMRSCAGITVDPVELQARPHIAFTDHGLDSLGLLAVVGELEQRYGVPITADAESCQTPRDLLDVVHTTVLGDAAPTVDTTETGA
ncbi:acyl carrier protein [Streptomyces sp. B1866]|uniref:acyl carrier protein n=1 Tax=Streptomyces sp. B1866 TaxID=3075431 RepID=UPI00288CA163|nr:acyl carrier protein [Streptomyces sp. B1866]MDT3397996.1 acyl carrier protein [Streptomyces sp. B1866]